MKVSPTTGAKVLRALKAVQTKPMTVKEILGVCATRAENPEAAALWKALQRATGQQTPESTHVGAFFRDNSDLQAKPLVLTRPWSSHYKQKLIFVEVEKPPAPKPEPVPEPPPPPPRPQLPISAILGPVPPPRPVVKLSAEEIIADSPADQHAMRLATAPSSGPTHNGAPIYGQPERVRRVPEPVPPPQPKPVDPRRTEIARLLASRGFRDVDVQNILAIDRIRTARGQSLWQPGMSCLIEDYGAYSSRGLIATVSNHDPMRLPPEGANWNPFNC